MSRVVITVELNGQQVKALVETGALNSYVERSILPKTIYLEKRTPIHLSLGGQTFIVEEECLLTIKIDGMDFSTDAFVVENLGKLQPEDIKFGIILGARSLEKYGIKVDVQKSTLDLSGLQRREFTEF